MTTEAEENPVIRFAHAEEIRPTMLEFLRLGSRSLDIFSHNLPSSLYDDKQVVAAVSAFARSSGVSKVRLLVRNTKGFCGINKPLVSLCQRLPSHAAIREYTEGAKDPDMGFFCVDKRHIIFFNDEPSMTGFSRKDAPLEATSTLEEFNHLWIYGSKVDPDLRQLSL